MKKDQYECYKCKGIFTFGDNDGAEKEAKELWGGIPKEERIILCDDCFKLIPKDLLKKVSDEYKNEKKKT